VYLSPSTIRPSERDADGPVVQGLRRRGPELRGRQPPLEGAETGHADRPTSAPAAVLLGPGHAEGRHVGWVGRGRLLHWRELTLGPEVAVAATELAPVVERVAPVVGEGRVRSAGRGRRGAAGGARVDLSKGGQTAAHTAVRGAGCGAGCLAGGVERSLCVVEVMAVPRAPVHVLIRPDLKVVVIFAEDRAPLRLGEAKAAATTGIHQREYVSNPINGLLRPAVAARHLRTVPVARKGTGAHE